MTCSLLHFLPLKSEHEALNDQLSDGSRTNSYRAEIFKGQIAIQWVVMKLGHNQHFKKMKYKLKENSRGRGPSLEYCFRHILIYTLIIWTDKHTYIYISTHIMGCGIKIWTVIKKMLERHFWSNNGAWFVINYLSCHNTESARGPKSSSLWKFEKASD